jgi:hypothetical protein
MTRGNQRDLARERKLKKDSQKAKSTELPEGMSLAQKKAKYLFSYYFSDAEIMRQKQNQTNKK